jgi:hypothetical protein
MSDDMDRTEALMAQVEAERERLQAEKRQLVGELSRVDAAIRKLGGVRRQREHGEFRRAVIAAALAGKSNRDIAIAAYGDDSAHSRNMVSTQLWELKKSGRLARVDGVWIDPTTTAASPSAEPAAVVARKDEAR